MPPPSVFHSLGPAALAIVVGQTSCGFPNYQLSEAGGGSAGGAQAVGAQPAGLGGLGETAGGTGSGGRGGAPNIAGETGLGGAAGMAGERGLAGAPEVSGDGGSGGDAAQTDGGSMNVPILGLDITQAGTPIAFIKAPTGAGSRDLEVLRDGDLPPAGSDDSLRQYDTFTDDSTRSMDWLGYAYDAPKTFMRVTFQNGKLFSNGGWFESLAVQVQNGGLWTDVAGVRVTPSYAGQAGTSYAIYQFDFTPVRGAAIRVFGRPGGGARFVSCGELRIFEAALSGT